ncbi:MAG: DUF3108 domain-containing protein [Candidatus Lernaella stagnicola]|nr:DUF3108 domain-containing protein [Candidatus Lernaella stagnicola]
MKNAVAAFAGLWLFGDARMAQAMQIDLRRVTDNEAADPKKLGAPDRSGFKQKEWEDPDIVKPFLNERFEYRISFLSIKTATGVITFKRTGRNQYTASMEGTISGLVGAVTDYRKVVMTSVMQIRQIDGKRRFVAVSFYRKTIKTDGERVSRHDFNYIRRRWFITRTSNGKMTSRKKRRIPRNVYYDDFVCLMYNFRAQVYGPVKPGLDVTIKTLPLSRRVTVNGKKVRKHTDWARIYVLPADKISGKDQSFMKDIGADFMVEVHVDKGVYGMKTGIAKFYGKLKTMEPMGVRSEDVLLFGDVSAARTK